MLLLRFESADRGPSDGYAGREPGPAPHPQVLGRGRRPAQVVPPGPAPRAPLPQAHHHPGRECGRQVITQVHIALDTFSLSNIFDDRRSAVHT